MGLLETLENKTSTQKKNFCEQVSVDLTPPGRDPVPCEICRSPFFWLDAFGTARCCDCSPSPARSLVRFPLLGIAGPPGGPWWWETLGNNRRAFGGDRGAEDGSEQPGGDEVQLVEHDHHGHQLLTIIGSGTVAGSRDNWTKCLVFCWNDNPKSDEV